MYNLVLNAERIHVAMISALICFALVCLPFLKPGVWHRPTPCSQVCHRPCLQVWHRPCLQVYLVATHAQPNLMNSNRHGFHNTLAMLTWTCCDKLLCARRTALASAKWATDQNGMNRMWQAFCQKLSCCFC